MKTALYGLLALILIGGAVYLITKAPVSEEAPTRDTSPALGGAQPLPEDVDEPVAQEPTEPVFEPETVIGTSVEGRNITAYHYGTGDTELLFVGGIHGGYSWNTALVAYELMDYLEANSDNIPENVKVTVIPVLNPDGLNTVVGTAGRFLPTDVPQDAAATVPGRYNAHTVDLNRNFDCDWQATGTWQSTRVSGGSAAFSEPESLAFKTYVDTHKPAGAVVWYSAVGGVFSSNCHNGVLPETSTLTSLYAKASGYPAYEEFDYYEVTGDMVNWLAKENVPAISVLLTTHDDIEWEKNKAGVEAILKHYAR